MKLRPVSDFVVVEPAEADEKTAKGIYLPQNAKEKPTRGKVLAVGPGKVNDNGTLIPMSVKSGDVVLYERYAGMEIKIDDKERIIVHDNQIVAIID